MTLRLAELETKWPTVPWREPINVVTPKGEGLGCRVCIANDGFKAKDVSKLPQSREKWDEHLRTHLDG